MAAALASKGSIGLRGVLRHKGVLFIGVGWGGFIAENLILSENRQWIIERFGEDNYIRAYGGLSTAACASIGYGYLRHGWGKGPRIRAPGLGSQVAAFALQSTGLIGAFMLMPKLQVPVELGGDAPANTSSSPQTQIPKASGFKLRCPMDFKAGDSSTDSGPARVTRHAAFWAMGFVGLGTAIATPFATEFVMFASPAVFALVGGLHQDSRFRRGMGGTLTAEREQQTSCLPFVALLEGRQSWQALAEDLRVKSLNVALGVTVALGLAVLRRGR